ncbi:MAG: hypothetical protein AAEJ04_10615 [Planctomycetota bacterium]
MTFSSNSNIEPPVTPTSGKTHLHCHLEKNGKAPDGEIDSHPDPPDSQSNQLLNKIGRWKCSHRNRPRARSAVTLRRPGRFAEAPRKQREVAVSHHLLVPEGGSGMLRLRARSRGEVGGAGAQ